MSNNFSDVIHRFKHTFGFIHDKEVGKAIGIEPAGFSYMKKKGNLPVKEILDYIKDKQVSPWYIIYGEGEKITSPKLPLPDSAIPGPDQVKINYRLSEGGGVDSVMETGEEYGPATWIDKNLLPRNGTKELDARRVPDDSMAPKINRDDVVFVNKRKHKIVNGKVYIVKIGTREMIKRVFFSTDGYILKTDNDNYPEFEVKENEVEIIGEVMFALEYIG